MRRRIVIAGLCTLIAIALLIYLTAHKGYEGYYWFVGDRIVDPVGEYREYSNRITRDCSSVTNVKPDSRDWLLVQGELRRFFPDSIPSPWVVLKSGSWFLAESDFSNGEPGILLIESAPGGARLVGAYGGTAAPYKDAPIIRGYFLKEFPAAPRALIQCYDPVGPPFRGLGE